MLFRSFPELVKVCHHLSFSAYGRDGDKFSHPNDAMTNYARDKWKYEVRGEDHPHVSSGEDDANALGDSNTSSSLQPSFQLGLSDIATPHDAGSLNTIVLNSLVGESRNTETELSVEKQALTNTSVSDDAESLNTSQLLLNSRVGESRNTETELSVEKQAVTNTSVSDDAESAQTATSEGQAQTAAASVTPAESCDPGLEQNAEGNLLTTLTSEGHAQSNAAAHAAMGESSVVETPSGESNVNGVNSAQGQRTRKNKRSSPDTAATATEASAKKSRTVSEEDDHTTFEQALVYNRVISWLHQDIANSTAETTSKEYNDLTKLLNWLKKNPTEIGFEDDSIQNRETLREIRSEIEKLVSIKNRLIKNSEKFMSTSFYCRFDGCQNSVLSSQGILCQEHLVRHWKNAFLVQCVPGHISQTKGCNGILEEEW